MTRYMVFGWSQEAAKENGPADQFYGTTIDEPGEGTVNDEWTIKQEPIRLADGLLFDREYTMEVERNAEGTPIIAYFPILTREEYNERGLISRG